MENEPNKLISTFPKSRWRIWLWGLILFLAIFLVIKEVSKFKVKEAPEETFTFDKVDHLPSFPAGEKAFGDYLQQNIHADANIRGLVIASFVVDKTGTLINIKILRGLSASADQEVIRVLEASPKWNPGKQNGKAVNVAYALPVNFDH